MAGANWDVFICFLFLLGKPSSPSCTYFACLSSGLTGGQRCSDEPIWRGQSGWLRRWVRRRPRSGGPRWPRLLGGWVRWGRTRPLKSRLYGMPRSAEFQWPDQIPSNTVQRCRMLQLGFLSLRPGAVSRAPLKLHRWQARHLATRSMPSSVKRCKTHTNQICLAFTRHEVEVNPVMTLGILG